MHSPGVAFPSSVGVGLPARASRPGIPVVRHPLAVGMGGGAGYELAAADLVGAEALQERPHLYAAHELPHDGGGVVGSRDSSCSVGRHDAMGVKEWRCGDVERVRDRSEAQP